MQDHVEHLNKNKIKIISLISFLLGFSQAIFIYVISSYFKTAIHSENVGIFYLISYSVVLILMINYQKLANVFGKSKVFLISLVLKGIFLALLLFLPPSIFSLISVVIFMILEAIGWLGIDVILESFSTDRMSGRIRGLQLTIMNAGILIGPFLSVAILQKFDFRGIFFLIFLLNLVVIAIAMRKLKDVPYEHKEKMNILRSFKKVFGNKDILCIYYISFLLEFFYALMIIYSPIYLRDLGVSWNQIGIIFTIMLTPFIFLQYPAGLFADKKAGEKELMIFSIFVMAASTLAFYFTQTSSVVLWAGILLSTRIGASLIEVLRDSYFYKQICGEDVDMVGFFRTTRSIAYIASSLVAVLALTFFSIRSIFVIIALVGFSALIPAIWIKDSQCESETKTSDEK